MVKYKNYILLILLLFFLVFSFYPTYFELSNSQQLVDKNREFILEHNYYWPDFNLYLSKIRQGWEGRWSAVEKYTTEPHQGSLIQEFYVVLGHIGKGLNLDPNFSYQLGRIILSPILLLLVIVITRTIFKSAYWQIIAFVIILISGSFPRVYYDELGILHLGRYMDWWSNIDALQRITFIPHILFGQIVSFFLLYKLAMNKKQETRNRKQGTKFKLILFVVLGNITGLVFPPSLITLLGVLFLILVINFIKNPSKYFKKGRFNSVLWILLFSFLSLPSLLYLFIMTRQIPWSALVEAHRLNPMMVPLDQYILATGPIIFLGFFGAIVSIVKKDKNLQPLIYWILVTLLFAAFFSVIKEQSPLRFTQTGLFIPLGILGTYLLQEIWKQIDDKEIHISYLPAPNNRSSRARGWKPPARGKIYLGLFVICFLLINLVIMQNSLIWQTDFVKQRVRASIPPVPYPPQTLYPLTSWMDGIRWLRNNTDHNSVVLAELTAANFIPAYSGNYVYFGQTNTVDYDRKLLDLDRFFRGNMTKDEAQNLLNLERIKYVFFSYQESEKLGNDELDKIYPFLNPVYTNSTVTIYNY